MTILSNLSIIRYYTALDPYYYTVDNRPIKDLRNNVEEIAAGTDAALQGEKSVATALGFVARGYAMRAGIDNDVIVGEITTAVFDWTMDHAFIVQPVNISGTDARPVPKLGLTIDAVTYDFQPAATVGTHLMYTVDAKIVAADATSPFFDPANPSYGDVEPFEVGNIEYVMTADPTEYAVSTPPPAPAAGYLRVAIIRVPEGAVALTPEMTTYVRFKEDGVAFGGGAFSGDYELNIDAREIGGSGPLDGNITVSIPLGTTTVDSIPIDPEYALVFVDGVYQTGYQVVVPDTIVLPRALPDETKLAFVSTAGGTYTGGKYHEQIIAAPLGAQVFNNLEVRPDFSTLYIDGVYQGGDTYAVTGSDQITLNVPLVKAANLYLVERSAGLADNEVNVPSGGAIGEVLTKDSGADYDMSWQPATGGGASLPAADPVSDLGKVLTYTGLDALLEPSYDWRTVTSGGIGGSSYLHQDIELVAASSTVVASQDPTNALIFVGGMFQGKAGRDFTITNLTIDFGQVLPIGTVIDIVFLGGSGEDIVHLLESSVLALVNSQSSYSKPQMVVNSTLNLGSGTYILGSYISSEIAISTDYGRSWSNSTPANLPTGIGGMASNGSRIVAVGAGSVIAYSDDTGVTWTDSGFSSVAGAVFFNNVLYNTDSGLFVAVGEDGIVAWSSDGASWSEQQINSNLHLKDVTLVENGGSGKWVAVGVDGAGASTSHVYYAADPTLVWTPILDTEIDGVITGGYVKAISDGNTWVAAHEDGYIAYSVTPGVGTSWAITYDMIGSTVSRGIGYFDGIFVVFGDNNIAAVSMDLGSTWDEYVVGNGDANEIYTTLLADGTSGLILGAYDTARTFSKIRRA